MPAVRTAAILAVGSELLTPHRLDTNSLYLTGRLNDIGIDVIWKGVIGDNEDALAAAIAHARDQVDLVVTTGGLGPTADDVTREVIARVLGLALVEDAAILDTIRRRFERRGLHMPDGNRRQAAVPAGARVLANPHGTAPGLWIDAGPSIFVLLPGPPREMQPMFESSVLPDLKARSADRRVLRRVIRIAGRPESHVEEIANPVYSGFANGDDADRNDDPGVARPNRAASVRARFGPSQDGAGAGFRVAALEKVLAPAVYSVDGRTLEQVVGQELLGRGWKLAVAESCTGGLVGAKLTDVPGSSAWFAGGIVAYANDVKIRELGVPAEIIGRDGAVSEAVAVAMADGVRERFSADAGLSITGIAGPTGGSAEKPVGTVVIAVSTGPAVVRTYRFVGDRPMVRQQSVVAALELLRHTLAKAPPRGTQQ